MSAGSGVERLAERLFAQRRVLLLVFGVITLVLGVCSTRLQTDAGFEKSIPRQHPYMKNYTEYRKAFGGANRILVALVKKHGDIYDRRFMAALKDATDDVFYIPGVERSSVISLFTPQARYTQIVEDGFRGGTIVDAGFQGTPQELAQVRERVMQSGEIGRLVANDLGGALIRAELQEVDVATGERVDPLRVAAQLEQIRRKYESAGGADIDVHIVGFAKAAGDIADGAHGVLFFFLLAFLFTAVLLLVYTRSAQLTALTLATALLPVLWLLGLLPLLGYGIDPLSILVPFLVFTIGVSHAVQMTSAWHRARTRGETSLEAARSAFVRLFMPGALALLANAIGFAVITLIRIDIVRELGVTAGLGVALMLVTHKLVLPVLLSYLPSRAHALFRSQPADKPGRLDALWSRLASVARRPRAAGVIAAAVALTLLAGAKARELQTGDLDRGLPELRAESRYNRDSATVAAHFSVGSDVLGVIVQTHDAGAAPCMNHDVMAAIDRFASRMRGVDGVQSVLALTDIAKVVNAAVNEGSLKWRALPRDPQALAQSIAPVNTSSGLVNSNCSAMQVLLFTRDHRGANIARIMRAVKDFQAEEGDAHLEFKLATGNVGVMAATNEAVDAAETRMIGALFGAIALMSVLAFRSVAAAACIVLPLALVSVLCNALMASLGIGLKVSTLPVIALGVGVGVDYGIYLYAALGRHLRSGLALPAAFRAALQERGAAIVFTALTMAGGVAIWTGSALKFQADMGLLLAFMFVFNMVGALLLLPAIAAWLLPRASARDDGVPLNP